MAFGIGKNKIPIPKTIINYIMQNRFVHIVLYFIVCCFSYVAIANNSYQQDTVTSETKKSNTSYVVREQVSRSKFVRITFLDDSCDTTRVVNKGIKYFELSEYINSQMENLNKMSIKILDIFPNEMLLFFEQSKISPIQCQLTVSKEGRILNVAFICHENLTSKITDQQMLDMQQIVLRTRLGAIPYETTTVQFNWAVPRKLIARLLESKN